MKEKRTTPFPVDAGEYSRFVVGLAAIALAEYVISITVFGIHRPLFLIAGATLVLALPLIWTKRHTLALRSTETAFGVVLLIGLFWGNGHEYGTALAFLPFLALYCLYFDGYRAFVAVVSVGTASIGAWYAINRASVIGPDAFVLLASTIFFIFILSFLIMRNFFLSLVRADDLLAELHHRVRNTLLVVSGLFPGRIETERVCPLVPFMRFRIRLTALLNVQALIARSGDLLHISAQSLAETIARTTAEELGMAAEIAVEGTGRIPVDRAAPLALLLSDWLSSTPLLHADSLRIAIQADKDRGILAISSSPPAGEPPSLSPLTDGLLRQLGARPPKPENAGLSFEFALAPPVTVLPANSYLKLSARVRKEDFFYRLLMGKAALQISALDRNEIATLVVVLVSSLVAVLALNLNSISKGESARIPGLLVALSTIPSFALLHKGKVRLAAYSYGIAFIGVLSLAFFNSPDAAIGIPLIGAMAAALYFIYFTGDKGGGAAIAWGLVAHIAWFLFFKPKRMPDEVFTIFAAAYCFFTLSALLFIKKSHARLRSRESLIIDLRTRIYDFLALLLSRLDSDQVPSSDEFDRRIDEIVAVHSIAAESPDSAAISLHDAFESLSKWSSRRIEAEFAGPDSLPAEKATLIMLLLLELEGQAVRSLQKPALLVAFSRAGGRASISVRAKTSDAAAGVPIPPRDEKVLKTIEALLRAVRKESSDGAYAISFGV